jgi:3-oxoacyl-[acyl-carrier protein] reductase
MTKIVVVTGCSRGLGQNISERLIESGYKVIGISRSRPLESSKYLDFFECDLSDIDSVTNCAQEISRKYPNLYGLVNNAANGNDGFLPTQHNSEILELIRVNMIAPIILTKYLSRAMLVNNEGRILNISSIVATTGYRGLSAYAATKGGLISFSRSLARDLGPANITVNCIQPGYMESDMTSGLSAGDLAKVSRRSALGTLVNFRDISNVALLLLSEDGARITGSSFVIDAGNSA